jgi:hypothetical protein
MRGRWELTDEQWERIEPVLRPAGRTDNRGRPWHDTRAVLNGVLWVLGTGAQWRELPEKLNSDEAFVDATFASAKKGASPSVPPVAARARRSSLSPLLTVFLSPLLSTALHQPSASLWSRFLPQASSPNSRHGSWETKPTTRTNSTKGSRKSTTSR